MPSPFSSLILATSLVALPASAAIASSTAPPNAQAPASGSSSGTKAAATAPAKPAATTAAKGKRATKARPPSRPSGKIKDARTADCDTPETKVAAVKPAPIPADPFAPVVAPCADPKR